MTIEDITRKYLNGDYETKLPFVSDSETYYSGYIFDKTKSAEWNQKKLMLENYTIKKAAKAYQDEQIKLSKQLKDNIISALIIEYNLKEEIAKKIEAKAYADQRHCILDYFKELDKTAAFVEEILNIENEVDKRSW